MPPTLHGERVTLAPFRLEDAPLVQHYAGDEAVARTTLHIPHPYPDGMAEEWIASHAAHFAQERNVVYAIRSPEGELYGAIDLELYLREARAVLGYWIAVPFWNRGYCTDAARCVIKYAFANLAIDRIEATHWVENPASGRVMLKAGLRRTGFLEGHVMKNGVLIDVIAYVLARREYEIPEA